MIKKLFLLLVFTNGFISTQGVEKVRYQGLPKRPLHTSHSKKARKKTFQNKKFTTSKARTQKNKLNRYFVISCICIVGVVGIPTLIYVTNKDSNNYVFPEFTIPDNITPKEIKVDLKKTFADNDPIKIKDKEYDFQDDKLTTKNPEKVWEHHIAVKKCMANKDKNYKKLRKKHFYRFTTKPPHPNIEDVLKKCENQPMYYHCTGYFQALLRVLESQFLKPSWGAGYPGAFLSTEPEVKKYGPFIIAFREEAAWDSPAMTSKPSVTKPKTERWGGLSEPLSIWRYAQGFYIGDRYKLSFPDLGFEMIEKGVNEIKYGLLTSLRAQFNTAKDNTEKKQIIELANNIIKIEVKKYSALTTIKLPIKEQIAPKTWLVSKDKNSVCIVSDENGVPQYVKGRINDHGVLRNVKGIPLKQGMYNLLEPITQNVAPQDSSNEQSPLTS